MRAVLLREGGKEEAKHLHMYRPFTSSFNKYFSHSVSQGGGDKDLCGYSPSWLGDPQLVAVRGLESARGSGGQWCSEGMGMSDKERTWGPPQGLLGHQQRGRQDFGTQQRWGGHEWPVTGQQFKTRGTRKNLVPRGNTQVLGPQGATEKGMGKGVGLGRQRTGRD